MVDQPDNRYRDFDAEESEEEDLGPIRFKADGQDWTAIGSIPGGVLYDLSKGDNALVLEYDYIVNVLVEDDIPRWHESSRRRGTKLSTPQIDKIFSWLAEVYSGRDLNPPTDSTGGSSNGATGPISVPSS